MNKLLLLTVGLGLAACAPTQTREQPLSEVAFAPMGPELAAICAGQPRVAQGGVLIWNDGGPVEAVRQAPYRLACPEFTLDNDGATLMVQDTTLEKALTHFDREAYFLTYYADLGLHFPEDGLVSADPTAGVSEVLMDDVRKINVTAVQPGKAEMTLLKGAQVTPVRYDPAQPLKLLLRGDPAIPWPEVTLEASRGLITASIFR